MTPAAVLELIRDKRIRFVDLRFTDTRGKEQHLTIPARLADEALFEDGRMIDGSAMAGWKSINESDLVLMPDPATARVDVFSASATLNMSCDVLEPRTLQAYARCPRMLARRAEAHLRASGIADEAYFGPENEFFIFDDVRYSNTINESFHEVDSIEGAWNSGRRGRDGGSMGHRPGIKGGYSPVPPVDSLHDIRSSICLALEEMGAVVEVHHHEVATAGQCEIGVAFGPLVRKGDEVQLLKYVVHNVVHGYGKTATFMPKPLVGDNGSGMHVHQSLARDGRNLFAGDGYAGLSELALHYIGGLLRHAPALNAFANASTNSYRRLIPHFEAPVKLAYSAGNRSAAIRIPISDPAGRRVELRFPDSTANPYLAFSAMLMAGLDGIRRRIDPGEAMDKDLYDLPPEEASGIAQVAASLEQALEALHRDREFLLVGDVFSADLIDSYIDLKMQDVTGLRAATHPLEFELYYSL